MLGKGSRSNPGREVSARDLHGNPWPVPQTTDSHTSESRSRISAFPGHQTCPSLWDDGDGSGEEMVGEVSEMVASRQPIPRRWCIRTVWRCPRGDPTFCAPGLCRGGWRIVDPAEKRILRSLNISNSGDPARPRKSFAGRRLAKPNVEPSRLVGLPCG